MNDGNNDDSSLSTLVPTIDTGFDFASDPLIPTQFFNQVTPSILSMSNSILSTSAESSVKGCDVTSHDSSSLLKFL